MTGKERIITALQRKVPDRVPTFEWFIDPAIARSLGIAEDPISLIQHLELDGINLRPDYQKHIIDALTFSDEWGKVQTYTGEVLPVVKEYPIKDITAHRDFQFPDPDAPDRFLTIEKALKQFGDSKAIILNIRDGFSDIRDLVGYEHALTAMLLEPGAFKDLLKRVVEYNIRLAEVAKDRYNLEIVATTDDIATATGLIVRPKVYFELLGSAFQEITQEFRRLGYAHIKHCDGKIDDVLDFWIDAGISAIDPIDPAAGYDLALFKEKYGHRICLKGNVDCKGALCYGTPEEVRQEVRDCLRKTAPGGGYILSSSNTIHSGVKPENYLAMVDELCS